MLAVQEIKNGMEEWRTLPDGDMLYQDFEFASEDDFSYFQYLIRQDRELDFLTWGDSYGQYPRSVRTYYPLMHEKYPLIPFEKHKEELSVIVKRRDARAARIEERRRLREKKSAPY